MIAVLSTPPQLPVGPALVFADSRHGWAGGAGGILRTSNGGRTWRRVSHLPVQALDAVGPTSAFALAADALLRTTDGRRWQTVSHRGLVAVDFFDRKHGYGLNAAGTLLVTSNGGRSFARARAPARLQALCATRRGVWVARGGVVWAVGSGRFSLQLRARLGAIPAVLPQLGCRGLAVWALLRDGAAAGSEAYDLFRSLDRGRTWRAVLAGLDARRRRLPRLDAYAGPFSVLGSIAAFIGVCPACGRQPTAAVHLTTNGGRSWRRGATLDGYGVAAVSFVTARRGWLLTGSRRGRPRAGLVWSTADGGGHWRLLLRSPLLTTLAP